MNPSKYLVAVVLSLPPLLLLLQCSTVASSDQWWPYWRRSLPQLQPQSCGSKGPPAPQGEPSGYILGVSYGKVAMRNEFPWLGQLVYEHQTRRILTATRNGTVRQRTVRRLVLCSAMVLNRWWVLSAAHCVLNATTNEPLNVTKFHFVAGEEMGGEWRGGEQT